MKHKGSHHVHDCLDNMINRGILIGESKQPEWDFEIDCDIDSWPDFWPAHSIIITILILFSNSVEYGDTQEEWATGSWPLANIIL